MRTITLIIIHCSATPEGKSLSAEACRLDHILHRGFRDIGYHFYITRDGEIHRGRPLEKVGAHCRNHNSHSIGTATKEDWMLTVARRILERLNNGVPCWLYYANCAGSFRKH